MRLLRQSTIDLLDVAVGSIGQKEGKKVFILRVIARLFF